jgi:hypothetical protein
MLREALPRRIPNNISVALTPKLSCERVNNSERSELQKTARRLQRQLDRVR